MLALFPAAIPVSSLLTAAFNAAAAALAVLYIAVARALDRRQPWAVAAVRPLLLLVAAAGIYSLLIALGDGKLRIPFEALLAIWAWLGPADTPPIPRLERRSAGLLVATVGVVAVMLFGQHWFGWGGVLDVHEPDLQASIEADCGTPGAGPPQTLTVTYDWSWRSTSPLASGTDIVVIGWTGADAKGRPLYVISEIPEPGAGIYSGIQGYPSVTMAEEVARESEGSFRWGIQLSEQQFRSGHIEVQFNRAREVRPEPSTLAITASYVHLGLWRHATSVICTW